MASPLPELTGHYGRIGDLQVELIGSEFAAVARASFTDDAYRRDVRHATSVVGHLSAALASERVLPTLSGDTRRAERSREETHLQRSKRSARKPDEGVACGYALPLGRHLHRSIQRD